MKSYIWDVDAGNRLVTADAESEATDLMRAFLDDGWNAELQALGAMPISGNPRVQGGEPIVRGTRIPVRAIVVAWREYRDVPTWLEAYPRLSEDDLWEALAYYEAHRQEMDEIIRLQLTDG